MATGGGDHRRHSKGRHQRLLFVVEEDRIRDQSCYAYLVIRINLKEMFASAAEEEDWTAAMRNFPSPMAELRTAGSLPERLKLAAVSGTNGTNIVAVSFSKHTIIYDTAAAAEVPCGSELRYDMTGGPALIPLGTRLYAVPYVMWPPSCDGHPNFQALLPPAQRGGNHGRWFWRALPAPPAEMCETRKTVPFCSVTAFLAAGTRVWISAPGRGTYSFDTVHLAWCKEGDWELPFQERGLFVPDLGLCFGLCPHRCCLCAFDLPTAGSEQPPSARYVWQETFPYECHGRGFHVAGPGSLAYLGDGKFCITWTISIEHDQIGVPLRFALILMAVQVIRCSPHEPASEGTSAGELRLVNRKVRCYKMSNRGISGYVLQPSVG